MGKAAKGGSTYTKKSGIALTEHAKEQLRPRLIEAGAAIRFSSEPDWSLYNRIDRGMTGQEPEIWWEGETRNEVFLIPSHELDDVCQIFALVRDKRVVTFLIEEHVAKYIREGKWKKEATVAAAPKFGNPVLVDSSLVASVPPAPAPAPTAQPEYLVVTFGKQAGAIHAATKEEAAETAAKLAEEGREFAIYRRVPTKTTRKVVVEMD